MSIHKITVKGKKTTPTASFDSSDDLTTLRETFVIDRSVRGATESHTIDLQDNDLIEMIFEDNTIWFSSKDNLEEIFPEAATQKRSADGSFEIPVVIQSSSSERGIIGAVSLKIINIFTRKSLAKKVREIAADLEKKQLENQIGLFRLDAAFQFQNFTAEEMTHPYLLFIHGTASSTQGSFGGLMLTTTWRYIQQTYGARVLAFQHETLTKSPLENVLDLVKALPSGISLHLLSQSRGGIVGEVLARFCHTDENNRGFDDNEIEYLRKSDRHEDIEQIKLINEILRKKKISVKRFIRVACPAHGSILASKRLDNLLNITFNLIGLGTTLTANPVYSGFKNLIASVIDCKNEADVLPGLEVQNPDSAFIKVLNNPATKVVLDSPLVVISGNCKVKLNLKALLVIASKLFYFTDNDLVVNTNSMYQGTKRLGRVQYYFDENAEVDHFHYFKNENTNQALLRALEASDDAQIPGFSLTPAALLGEGERQALLNLEGGQIFENTVTGSRPIVVVLPGIMGSTLSRNGDRFWINYFKFITGGLTALDIKNNGFSAPAIVKTSYKKLVDHLSGAYDVVTFPFDWRLPLTESAKLLSDKITELLTFRQPIKIIGHSMGGVLVRDFIVHHPQTWQALNQSAGFQLLFLGAPLGGSFRIPAVLCGKDALIDKLDRIDIFHRKEELLEVFSKFPGMLCLLPLTTDADRDFSKTDTWRKMSEPLGTWPLPHEKDLNTFGEYRDKVNKGMQEIDYTHIAYIAGKDKATPNGYQIEDTLTGKDLVFYSTAEGDQSVTWETGIPKPLIENNSVYYVNVTHGALANEPGIFQGIDDILLQGFTNRLSKTRPSVRGEEKRFRAPQHFDFDLSPEGIEKTILGLEAEETVTVTETPIEVFISNGDLRYAAYPVLAGHFMNDGILYAEKSIDHNLKGALSERHQLGLYPGEVGTGEILITSKAGFPGAIVVGLGKFGTLTAFQLVLTVEQGVTKYLLGLNDKMVLGNYWIPNADRIGLSALIIGCGFGGLSIENSIRAVIQGVQHANNKMKKLHAENAKTIQTIEFIELYEDTALSCFYSLSKIENEENKSLNIVTNGARIKTLPGSRKRLPTEAEEGWWKRITVELNNEIDASDYIHCLKFSASTGGAREEQRKLYSSTPIVEQLINDISTDNRWSPALAKTIYELLIPNDFKEELKKQGNIKWILDKYTASYPWELLQDSTQDAKPLCINAGMIRQLATPDYRLKINAVAKNSALVIGDPDLKGFVNQLPGAYKEGQVVSDLLTANEFNATTILKGSPPEIIQALFSDDYKIIHLAGHGFFSEDSPESAGMVIGEKIFLSTREICQMSTVPELVFVNCCFLGKTSGAAEAYYRNRYKLAANIGTQLIDNGVKAVVAAGWAVDDAAALDFTKSFYESMFAGYSFGDAVQRARKVIYGKYKDSNNTWGAYQCYGDPFYKFRSSVASSKPYEPQFVIPEQAEVELNNLFNELEIETQPHNEFLERLTAIANAVDQSQIRNAVITEQEACIYADLCEYEKAIAKFESLLIMEQATFSVSTLEKYCHIKAKKYVNDFLKVQPRPTGLIAEMNKVTRDLRSLLMISPTAERYCLLGHTFKRKALFSSSKAQKVKALKEAAFYFWQAYSIQKSTNSAYALSHWLETEGLLVLLGEHQWGKTVPANGKSYDLPSSENAVKQLKEAYNFTHTLPNIIDYMEMVSAANVKLCQLIVNPPADESNKALDEILKVFQQLWNLAGSKGKKTDALEHLELLTDALSAVTKKEGQLLRKTTEHLKTELEKMI